MARVIPYPEFVKTARIELRRGGKERKKSALKQVGKGALTAAGIVAATVGPQLLSNRFRAGFFTRGGQRKAQEAFSRAAEAYKKAGGERASKQYWEAYRKAGDKVFRGRSPLNRGPREGWEQAKRRVQDANDAFRAEARTAYSKIPGLKNIRTKADAAKAYKQEARKRHPDLGGSTEKMKDLNATWNSFKATSDFSKLAMSRQWAALADSLVQ